VGIEYRGLNMKPHDRYKHDELYEKKQIRDFFKNKKNGICVEVGSNEPIGDGSQSWHLESLLDWRCFLIEPNLALYNKTKKLRPNAKILNYACVEPENSCEFLNLHIPISHEGDLVTGHASVEKNIDEHNYSNFESYQIMGKTLSEILNEFGVHEIDLLSIDVEGYEFEVLQGLDYKKYRPSLILLEDKHLYMTKHFFLLKKGYRLVQRLNRNCWYVRKDIKSPKINYLNRLKLFKRMFISIWFKKIHYALRHKTVKPFLKF